jgi:Holliday junction resolvase
MSLKRYAAKRDANEEPIRQALEAVGAQVWKISGKGNPDLLVKFRDVLFAFEVKSQAGQRTEAQEETQWPIVRDVAAALQAIKAARC